MNPSVWIIARIIGIPISFATKTSCISFGPFLPLKLVNLPIWTLIECYAVMHICTPYVFPSIIRFYFWRLNFRTFIWLQHFDDLVTGHFHSHAHDILSACRAYMGGAVVGSVVKGKIQDGSKKGTSSEFAASIRGMINGLVSSFTKIGAEDCEQFRCSW